MQLEEIQTAQSPNHLLLERLLVIAGVYFKSGSTRQAMDIYWSLVDMQPEVPQSQMARSLLMDQASRFERAGLQHAARSIYDRLLKS
jgi:hypothetical protein